MGIRYARDEFCDRVSLSFISPSFYMASDQNQFLPRSYSHSVNFYVFSLQNNICSLIMSTVVSFHSKFSSPSFSITTCLFFTINSLSFSPFRYLSSILPCFVSSQKHRDVFLRIISPSIYMSSDQISFRNQFLPHFYPWNVIGAMRSLLKGKMRSILILF